MFLLRCDGWYWIVAPRLLLLQVSWYFASFSGRMLSLVWNKNAYRWALGWIASSGLNKTILKKSTSHVPRIEHSEIYIRWWDGSATPKAQSHSTLTRLHCHECIWLQWKSRAEITSWRWAKIAILSWSPLACPCRTIGLPGARRGRRRIFLSLMKKEIILTGHGEKENSFFPVVTIKSSQAFPHWYYSIKQASVGLRGFITPQHLASCRFCGSLPGFCYHKESDPRPSWKGGD